MFQITNLEVKTQEKSILRGIDLTINPGEVVAIMGPNGSGKSTLANSLMGNPGYEVNGRVILDGQEILTLKVNQRSEAGLFLASQYPVAIPGLTVNSFLWQIYKKHNRQPMLLLEFRKWLEKQAVDLNLKPEILKRGLNDGFSGGERKKLEILQLIISNPKYIILDEIDSGLDVDALKEIARTVSRISKKNKIGVLVITHYQRILKYLVPDKVVIINNGRIVRSGDKTLVAEIEKKGYELQN